jgi:branched-chain amino acid transport system ATP-binding protein
VTLLRVDGLETSYGRSQILFGIGFVVARGEIVTLLGRNGMGKTTTVRSIMGLTPPRHGVVEFDGRSIFGCTPERVARSGIGLVPEGRQVFPTLTVEENLVATAGNRLRRSTPWELDRVFAMFPRLVERRRQMAGTLSGGEQQMLAIGRALMTNPLLLILDEATEGLAPVIRSEIWACLAKLKSDGQSIVLIDKNIRALSRLADRHYVLDRGRICGSGTPTELLANPEILHRRIGV